MAGWQGAISVLPPDLLRIGGESATKCSDDCRSHECHHFANLMNNAVPRPIGTMAAADSAKTVHSGAPVDTSAHPPTSTTASLIAWAAMAPPTRPAPCEAKYRHRPSPKKA